MGYTLAAPPERETGLGHRRHSALLRSGGTEGRFVGRWAPAEREDHMATGHVEQFPSDTRGLPAAGPTETVELGDGERFEFRIAPVVKKLGEHEVRMLAYNGSVPGPVLKVGEGTQVVIDVENHGDLDATVHWHGLRLD